MTKPEEDGAQSREQVTLPLRTVAIVGLGLIGGSLARDFTERGFRVLGYDRDRTSLRSAMDVGCVHAALGPALEGVDEADVLVIAVPVSAAPEVLATALPRLNSVRLVTDVGSTKQAIGAAAVALGIGDRFVGSHPLAGDHRFGWDASRTGLFKDARVLLCPTTTTRDAALSLATELWTSLGVQQPEIIDADTHDRQLAWTSHLPQVASTALALTLASASIEPADLGPGGRSATRLAGSSPEMWTDIALDNAGVLSGALATLEAHLGELRAALARADAESIRGFFVAGHQWSLGNGPAGELR